jgi:hypothetical protein
MNRKYIFLFPDSLAQFLDQCIEDVAGIGSDGNISQIHHRGLRVFVDGNNEIRLTNSCCVLDGSA